MKTERLETDFTVWKVKRAAGWATPFAVVVRAIRCLLFFVALQAGLSRLTDKDFLLSAKPLHSATDELAVSLF